MFLEFWREVGGPGQAEDVALQHVPAHLVKERVAKLDWDLLGRWRRILDLTLLRQELKTMKDFCFPSSGQQTHPRPVLDVADVELHGDVEAVKEVTSKHHGVHRGVDGMDPA